MRISFLVVLALSAAPIHTADACQCVDPTLAQAVQSADNVFVGTITEVEMKKHCYPGVPEAWDWCTRSYKHKMTVEGVWKGKVESRIVLAAPGGCGDCSYGGELKKGTRWLIFVDGTGPAYSMRICSGIEQITTGQIMQKMVARYGLPKLVPPPTN